MTDPKSLQSIAQDDTPKAVIPPNAVRHGMGGQYVSIGDGWLIPAADYEEYKKSQSQKG